MATHLIESVRSFFTPEVIDRAAARLDESREGIRKAIRGGTPTVLAALIHASESGQTSGLLADAREAAVHPIASSPATLFTGGTTQQPVVGGWATTLFGRKFYAISNSLASYAGIRTVSATSILNLLTPLSLGVVGRYVQERHLSVAGLSAFLSAQKPVVMAALPKGLSIGHLFGGSLPTTASTAPVRVPGISAAVPRGLPGAHWLWPVLLGIVVLALIVYLSGRGRDGEERALTPAAAPATSATKAGTAATVVAFRPLVSLELPNRVVIQANRGGLEEQLLNCLKDAACKAGRDRWFDFDHVSFEKGSARLMPGSERQVSNLEAILNAYPNAKVKIGGYTDRTGSEPANLRLSLARAEAVTRALRTGGITPAQLLEAEGYGSAFAKVPRRAPDDARKADRRIAVQLREK